MIFDFYLGVKVTWNKAQYPIHHVPIQRQSLKLLRQKVSEEMHLQENSIFNLWPWPWSQGHPKCFQYPLHHVTYSATKFEVAKSNRLGGETFTRKYILWPWSWGQGHTKWCPVPSTSCDLFTYKVWSCFLKRFRRRYIYKKRDGRTDARTARRTDGRRTDFDTKINTCIPFFSKEKSGYNNEPCTVCIRFITVLFAPLRQYYKISHLSNSNLPFWYVVRSFLKVWVYM